MAVGTPAKPVTAIGPANEGRLMVVEKVLGFGAEFTVMLIGTLVRVIVPSKIDGAITVTVGIVYVLQVAPQLTNPSFVSNDPESEKLAGGATVVLTTAVPVQLVAVPFETVPVVGALV